MRTFLSRLRSLAKMRFSVCQCMCAFIALSSDALCIRHDERAKWGGVGVCLLASGRWVFTTRVCAHTHRHTCSHALCAALECGVQRCSAIFPHVCTRHAFLRIAATRQEISQLFSVRVERLLHCMWQSYRRESYKRSYMRVFVCVRVLA